MPSTFLCCIYAESTLGIELKANKHVHAQDQGYTLPVLESRAAVFLYVCMAAKTTKPMSKASC